MVNTETKKKEKDRGKKAKTKKSKIIQSRLLTKKNIGLHEKDKRKKKSPKAGTYAATHRDPGKR